MPLSGRSSMRPIRISSPGIKLAVAVTTSAGALHAGAQTGPQPLWSRQIGTDGPDYATGIALIPGGGLYLSAVTDGALGAPNAGLRDCVVARYDSSGNQLWLRQFGTEMIDFVEHITARPNGGAFAC